MQEKNINDNIFKDVKFGDKFKTRDGILAIYWGKVCNDHRLITENLNYSIIVNDEGLMADGEIFAKDIVSRWED